MCGRYALISSAELLAEIFRLSLRPLMLPTLMPRYNVAPTQPAPVIRVRDGQRSLDALAWGLVPHWATDRTAGARMINARSETVGEKPAFRDAVRERRCLVPIDGFFEWKRIGSVKQPYFIHRADERPFALAGIWESWQGGDEDTPFESFSILTTRPNDRVRELHDRMPVMLDDAGAERWLAEGEQDPLLFADLFEPAPSELFALRPVNRAVNNARHDDPICIERAVPVEPERTLFD